MEKKQKEITPNITSTVLLIGFVVVMAAVVMFISIGEESKITKIGKATCEHFNFTFSHAKGEYTHCYKRVGDTGIKQPIDLWMDVPICERLYATPAPKPDLQSDMGAIYTIPSNQSWMPSGCEKESGRFNLSDKIIAICWRCKNHSQSISEPIPAGDWVCPI